MKIIGLTGGIGSGKTIVTQLMEIMGIPVYNTDEEAKRIMNENDEVREKLVTRFGSSVYSNNKLDKTLLANLIFNNKENIDFVNSVVHPAVFEDFSKWAAKRNHSPYTAIESAILFESGFDKKTDITICVSAPLEIRIERLLKRNQTNREAILNRMKNQMSEEEKEIRADYILLNDNIKPLIPQLENTIRL
jgi:dephospho-CoA kinase